MISNTSSGRLSSLLDCCVVIVVVTFRMFSTKILRSSILSFRTLTTLFVQVDRPQDTALIPR